MVYPCRVSCTDPLVRKLALRATYDPPGVDTAANEWVVVTNVSTVRLSLDGYQLWSWPYGYTFPPGTALAPRESLVVRLDSGPTSRLVHYWRLGVPAGQRGRQRRGALSDQRDRRLPGLGHQTRCRTSD